VRLLLFNVTVTDATGAGVTVSVAEPETPSLVAVIPALPALTPVIVPVAETVATLPLLLAKLTIRPVSVLPFASFNVTTA
jgi:hypothetical protein